jgi:hypothetical protein
MEALKCPVCEGKQTVAAGFYGDASVSCRSCDGKGYVLAPHSEPVPHYVPVPYYPFYPSYPMWPVYQPTTTGTPLITWGMETSATHYLQAPTTAQ